MKKILRKILPKKLKLFIIEHRYIFKIKKLKYKKELSNLLNKDVSLIIDNKDKWIKKLVKLSYSNPKFMELGKAFANSEIDIIKKIGINENDIILICVEKDNLIKLKKFINHHRKIGINKFVILDNDSSDGSFEWLKKQDDVFLLKTMIKYSSVNRVAWINRIIAYFGDNRWYIVLDSDELLVYNDYEHKSIKDVIKYCEYKRIIRCRALMLDMYAKDDYYINGNINDYLSECIYFDTDTYFLKDREDFINISGGMRERVFNMVPCVTKYPIFYFKNGDVHCRSHYLYPYKENFNSDCNFVILHYKHLPGEIEKYMKIVKEGNYYNGSCEYKKYLKVMKKVKNLKYINKNSCEYINSKSLNKINLYKKIDWSFKNEKN